MAKIERALLSVYDKAGIVELARALTESNIEILSTGGTAKLLRENGIAVTDVSEVTGFPEMMDGRVKTLHPNIHAGLLANTADPKHMEQIAAQGIKPIGLVVVNLYPFAETAAREDAGPSELIEQIDIGGSAMIRSAAKNFESVGVVTSPGDYAKVIEEIKANGELSLETRLDLARKVFELTGAYNATIAATLDQVTVEAGKLVRRPAEGFPAILSRPWKKAADLRYGENPHQRAALYRDVGGWGVAGARQLQGKELSYNNLIDLDAAWGLACEFTEPVAVIIKHTNPCGVGIGATQDVAYTKGLECDPVSAFGSVLGFNRIVTKETAEAIGKNFVEAIAALGFEEGALERFGKKKNLRLLEVNGQEGYSMRLRSIAGGLLAQENDRAEINPKKFKTVTEREPTAGEKEALLFGWRVVKHVKSNAIVFSNARQTVGVGAGQMSRVDSVKLAAQRAVLPLQGTVMASDAFFPFPDGVEEAAKVGITAVIQPGGSKRDDEVIAVADKLGLAMILTGFRHFRH